MNFTINYFSLIKALRDGINLYFKNLRSLLPIMGTIVLISVIILLITMPEFKSPPFIIETTAKDIKDSMSYSYSWNSNLKTGHFIGLLLLALYKSFMTNFCLALYNNTDKKTFKFNNFLSLDFDIISYLIARIRYTITSIIGLLLFLIPGLIWIPRYYFANYFIIDRQLHVGESFIASSIVTAHVKRKIWLFLGIKAFIFNVFVIGFQPITTLIIYLMLYVPIFTFAKISAYNQLLKTETKTEHPIH